MTQKNEFRPTGTKTYYQFVVRNGLRLNVNSLSEQNCPGYEFCDSDKNESNYYLVWPEDKTRAHITRSAAFGIHFRQFLDHKPTYEEFSMMIFKHFYLKIFLLELVIDHHAQKLEYVNITPVDQIQWKD